MLPNPPLTASLAASFIPTDTVTRIRDGDSLEGLRVELKWPTNPYQPVEAYGHRVDCVLIAAPDELGIAPDIDRGDIIVRTQADGFAALGGTNEFVVNGWQERASPGGAAPRIYYYLTGV